MVDWQRNQTRASFKRWIVVSAVVACLFSVSGRTTAEPPASISGLVDQLDDAEFSRREAAGNALQALGAEAVDDLVAAARQGSPELASRSVQLLERLIESDDVDVIDAADAALATLVDADSPHAAALAEAALQRHAATRQERAVAELKKHGAQIQYGPDVDLLGQPIGLFRENEEPETQLRPRRILIPRSWKGGTGSIAQLRRLPHLSNLEVYVENGSQVPIAEVQSLASVLPGLMVHQRGAYLGVGTSSNTDGCEIGEVKPGGPAAKAGLQRGDVVVSFDEHEIVRFSDLVAVLQDYEPGTTARITVQRGGHVLEVPVEVEAWEFAPIAESVQDRLMLPGQNLPRPGQLPAPLPRP